MSGSSPSYRAPQHPFESRPVWCCLKNPNSKTRCCILDVTNTPDSQAVQNLPHKQQLCSQTDRACFSREQILPVTLKHKVKIFLRKRSFDSCSPRVPRARPQQGLVLARTLPGATEESRGLFIYHIKAARSCSPNEERCDLACCPCPCSTAAPPVTEHRQGHPSTQTSDSKHAYYFAEGILRIPESVRGMIQGGLQTGQCLLMLSKKQGSGSQQPGRGNPRNVSPGPQLQCPETERQKRVGTCGGPRGFGTDHTDV